MQRGAPRENAVLVRVHICYKQRAHTCSITILQMLENKSAARKTKDKKRCAATIDIFGRVRKGQTHMFPNARRPKRSAPWAELLNTNELGNIKNQNIRKGQTSGPGKQKNRGKSRGAGA